MQKFKNKPNQNYSLYKWFFTCIIQNSNIKSVIFSLFFFYLRQIIPAFILESLSH